MNTKRIIVLGFSSLILVGGLTLVWWQNRPRSQPQHQSALYPLPLPPVSEHDLRGTLTKSKPRDYRLATVKTKRDPGDIPFSAERWTKFEDEYSIKEKSDSPLLYALQSAKYALDTTTFMAKEGLNSLQKSYRLSDLMAPDPSAKKPVTTLLSHTELKTVASLHDSQTDTAFFGVKLVVRYGQ